MTGQDRQSFFFTPLGTKAYTEEYESSEEEDPEEDAVSRCCAIVNPFSACSLSVLAVVRLISTRTFCIHVSTAEAGQEQEDGGGQRWGRQEEAGEQVKPAAAASFRTVIWTTSVSSPSFHPFPLFLLCKNCFDSLRGGGNRSFADPTPSDDLLTRKPGLLGGFARLPGHGTV